MTVSSNNFGGLDREMALTGIGLIDCRAASLVGNTIRGLKDGIQVNDCRHLTIGQNVIDDCLGGLILRNVSSAAIQGNSLRNCREGLTIEHGAGMTINGNQVDEAETPARLKGLKQTSITGNVFSGKQNASIGGEIQQLQAQANLGLPDRSVLDAGNGEK